MTLKLSKDLADVLNASGQSELEVVDPENNRTYFVVDAELHREAMEALRQLREHKAIAQGILEMEAGEGRPLDSAFDEVRTKLQRQS